MADAAAFFANKKKKKKAFKFNANKVDVTSVTSTVHVDAPALSTDQDAADKAGGAGASLNLDSTLSGDASKANNEQWDDEAFTRSKSSTATATATTGTTTELLDMKALDPKRNEQDNIAEKLRVEETKAQLAAAREGMEREAARRKEEEEQKKKQKEASAAPVASRFAGAAANVDGGSGGGGKWIPPHMRGGASAAGPGGIAGGLSRVRLGASASQKLDTQDEQLFPDLASADAIIEKQQKSQQPVYKAPKKTPVGGGATWASKPKISASAPKQAAPAPGGADPWRKGAEKPAQAPPPAAAPAPPPPAAAPAAAPAPAPEAAKPAKPLVKKTKKKKKDLSTFKPS